MAEKGCSCVGVFIASGLAFTSVMVIAGVLAYRFFKAEVDKINGNIDEQNQNP